MVLHRPIECTGLSRNWRLRGECLFGRGPSAAVEVVQKPLSDMSD